ncbi:methyltransferase [Mobilicoccus massiliensis]|uniref:methyltransferase n=1 Tax=Mobilicoccus massiliensis TaxID=1522310 RepID=UPI000694E474|nr:class I SAM-dependent methyltransferase [Mobilicoccus massiliensis]
MTTTPDFDRLYADDPDPWQVATSWYERRKIDVVLSSLRRPAYPVVWDAGCGTGELAAALVGRAEALLATDASTEAVALASARLAEAPSARVELSRLPDRPAGLESPPDLVVLSELLYYLSSRDRAATYALVDEVAAPDADLVLVHWSPRPDDAHCSGLESFNEASVALNARGWGRIVTHTDAEFLLGLFSRDVPAEVGGRDDDTDEELR